MRSIFGGKKLKTLPQYNGKEATPRYAGRGSREGAFCRRHTTTPGGFDGVRAPRDGYKLTPWQPGSEPNGLFAAVDRPYSGMGIAKRQFPTVMVLE